MWGWSIVSAYYRWFPGDYIRDTVHLGWIEDCAYRRLIDLYQIHGRPIKNDRAYIMRAVRAQEPEQQAAVDTILAEYFTLKSDGWHQKKCDSEIEFRRDASEHAKNAANSRWKKNHQENNNDSNARAMLGQCSGYANQNQIQIHIKSKALSVSATPKPDLAAQSREVLEYLNSLTGRSFRPVDATLKPIQARIKDGYSPARLKEIALLMNEKWGADERMVEYLRPKTLYTATNCANYDGILPNGVDDAEELQSVS